MAGPVQQRGWWFEDVMAGTVLHHPGGRTVTSDEHARLAWLTDNASDIHGDAHRAAKGAFGQPVVLGALSVAIVVGLAAPATGPAHLADRSVGRGWSMIHLSRVVLAGDTLRAESHIHAGMPDLDAAGGVIRRSIIGRNQRDEEVVRIEEDSWAPSRDEETKDC